MATPLRVLIIEDVEEDADLLIRELKKGGYDPTWERVETAEALRDALKEKAWDCIFCDYNLPLFSGPEALELFKKTGLTTPFVLVSGAVGEDAAVEIVKAGADDFLLKGNWTRLISLCLPLTAGGETLGIMHLRAPADDKGADPIEEAVTLIQTAAEQIALSLANIKLREDLRRQSIHDALTGLFNRRYLDETLPRETLRSKRGGEHLSVIMLDIDHFKKFNDEFGHEAGDLVLQTLGAFLKKGVRGGDIACRYGGEEFTVILPGASPEAAIEKAEKLRTGILTQRFIYGGRDLGKVTLSLGVATFPLHGETPEEVIAAADAALYRAKESGRNRVLSA